MIKLQVLFFASALSTLGLYAAVRWLVRSYQSGRALGDAADLLILDECHQVQGDYATWMRCSSCGRYSYTDATECLDHPEPRPMLPISNRQLARLLVALSSSVIAQQLPDAEQEQFALFFLRLEEYANMDFSAKQALGIYYARLRTESEQVRAE